jgi:DNA-binding winged helix-turn-helix (wHTH) protein
MAADSVCQPSFRFDVFELDSANQQLRRNEAPIDIPQQAFKILRLLAASPNQLVTRTEMKDALWPGQSYGDFDSRLNFAIKKLREVLDDDAERPRYVKTVRNAGYIFIAPVRTMPSGAGQDSNRVSPEPGRMERGGSWSAAHHFTLVAFTVIAASVGVVLVAGMHGRYRSTISSALAEGGPQPGIVDSKFGIEIGSVSAIVPEARQRIFIRGRSLGLHTPFANTDSAYLAIRDKSADWSAGRLIPQNWDEVTVDVESWTDTEIVVSGFSGDYGNNGWKLNAGDEIEIAVWNPQSGAGPALYHTRVVTSVQGLKP